MRRLARLPLVAAIVPVLVGLVAGLAAPAAAQPRAGATKKPRKAYVVDRVVAIVDNSIILESELAIRMTPYEADVEGIDDPKERARRLEKLRGQVLEELVNEELIYQAAGDARIEVTAKEIDAAITDIRNQNKLDEQQFQQALVAQGYTLSAYRQDIQRQLTRVKAMNQLVAPRVNVTDDEVRARYDQMVRRSEAVSAVQLSHILFTLPERPTEAEVTAAKATAADAMGRVKRGEAFAEVAAQVSEDPGTRAGGGELGWIERGSLDPQWEGVVFSMDKGELRGPISGPTGLHVFFVSEGKRNEMKGFDELKEQIRGDLRRREMDKQTQTWIADLRKKAFIDVKL